MTQDFDFAYLFLIALALGLFFMVWVLWNLTREIKR